MEKQGFVLKLCNAFKNLRFASAKNKWAKRLAKGVAIASFTSAFALSAAACDVSSIFGEKEKPDYSQYCQLLQNVLYNDEYTDLMGRYLSDKMFSGPHTSSFNRLYTSEYAYTNTSLLRGLPFNFLESVGVNTKDLIFGNSTGMLQTRADLYAKTYFFTVGDNHTDLYMHLQMMTKLHEKIRPEKKTFTDYRIDTYICKYIITEQEYSDLKMLADGQYAQTPFFIQELDKSRSPEIVHQSQIYGAAQDAILESLSNPKSVSIQNTPIKEGIVDFWLDSLEKDQNSNNYNLKVYGYDNQNVYRINFTILENRKPTLVDNVFDFDIGDHSGNYGYILNNVEVMPIDQINCMSYEFYKNPFHSIVKYSN